MRGTRLTGVLLATALACGGDSDPVGPQPITADPAVITGCTPTPPGAGESRAKHIECEGELVLAPEAANLLAAGRLGDIVLENAAIRIVIRGFGEGFTFPGSSAGNIVDAARHGHEDVLKEFLPIAELNIGDYDEIVIAEAGDDGPAEVIVRGPTVPVPFLQAAVGTQQIAAIVETHYILEPDATELLVRTFLFPRGEAGMAVQVGEVFFLGGRATPWLPGTGVPEGIVGTEFVASTGPDTSYGIVYPPSVEAIQFLSIQNITGALGPLHIVGDATPTDRWFVIGDGSAASISTRAWALRDQPVGAVAGTTAASVDVVIADSSDRAITVARADSSGGFSANLPPGDYRATAVSPSRSAAEPTAFTVTSGAMATADVPAGSTGHLRLTVASPAGDPLPARIVVRSTDGGRRIHYSGAAGSLDVDLPPGDYTVDVSRGVEYDAFTVDPLRIEADGSHTVAATLSRVVDTAGWIAIDTHLHSEMSTDSRIPLLDRLLSVAAEGIEIAMSTDHDFVTDYGPAVRALGLDSWLAFQSGVETSTITYGHFQLWPMEPDPDRAGGGALPWYNLSPADLFSDMRAVSDRTFIQVNHPRSSSSGYFNAVDFDREVGKAMRNPAELGFTDTDLSDFNFDAIEVANDFNDEEFATSFQDWLALVGHGHPAAATGSSDSHGASAYVGNSRTYVYVGEGNDSPEAVNLAAVDAALKQRKAVVSQGAFVTASLRDPEQGTITAPGTLVDMSGRTEATLAVKVQAPPWMPLARVRVFAGRIEIANIALDPEDTAPVRFDADIPLALDDSDGFYVVLVDPAGPGTPVLGTPVGSFTNPILYDRDGDASWTP